jgi:TatD DNase family protein
MPSTENIGTRPTLNPVFIDAHAHFDKYAEEIDDALAETERSRILTVAVAMDVPSYERTLAIAERNSWILPTLGVHPKRAVEYGARLRELDPLLERSPAIGEIGLDFYWVSNPSSYDAQRKVFRYLLSAATEQDKFVNVHTKGAEKEVLDLLERHKVRRAIIHWYSGPMDILRELIAYGAYFTIGVEILFSSAIKDIARAIPTDRLLTETDNPGGWRWLAGKVGMPRVLSDVIRSLAEARGATVEEIKSAVQDNFLALIQNDPWMETARRLLAPSAGRS